MTDSLSQPSSMASASQNHERPPVSLVGIQEAIRRRIRVKLQGELEVKLLQHDF